MGYAATLAITSGVMFPLAFAMVLMGHGAWGACVLAASTFTVAVLAIVR